MNLSHSRSLWCFFYVGKSDLLVISHNRTNEVFTEQHHTTSGDMVDIIWRCHKWPSVGLYFILNFYEKFGRKKLEGSHTITEKNMPSIRNEQLFLLFRVCLSNESHWSAGSTNTGCFEMNELMLIPEKFYTISVLETCINADKHI